MLLAFSMGTYVGKQVSDTDYKQKQLEVEYAESMRPQNENSMPAVTDAEVAELAQDIIEAERAVASEKIAKPEAQKPMDSGYTHLNAKQNDENKYKSDDYHAHHDAPTSPEKPKAPAPSAKPNINDKVTAAANRVAESLAPAPEPSKLREPSAQLPTVATSAIGKYTVQVASYASEPEAKEHTAKLKDKGFPAFYVPAQVQGKNWYRVSIGLFTEQKSAMDYRQEVLNSQASQTAIVQRIVK
jgi:cell division septation protein DedD